MYLGENIFKVWLLIVLGKGRKHFPWTKRGGVANWVAPGIAHLLISFQEQKTTLCSFFFFFFILSDFPILPFRPAPFPSPNPRSRAD